VSEASGVRFVECLPERPSGPALQQAALGGDHYLAEEFRFLAAKVAALAAGGCTAIGVVSASPCEGTTTVALGLAAALARSSPRRVLLLEATLRQPAVESYLGLPRSAGVAEWLSGGGQTVPIRTVAPPGFAVIAAGREGRTRPELLGSKRMGALVGACRLAFGFVVVDCPPLGLAVDAVAIQDLLDGFLLVVRARRTARETVVRAVSRLKQGRIHGVVFNNQPEIMPDGYGRYEQYGHGARS
jgi:Mrp family chromosome partitioning ATPase